MHFAEPLWLLAGVIVCTFVAWQYRRFDSRQWNALGNFIAPRLIQQLTASVSRGRKFARRALFVAGLGLIFVAQARPQAGFVWEETHRKGLELLFAVDTSKSMLSRDVKPNRLARAKLAVEDLVDKLNGDGVGLIAFAGDAFLQCPITLDYNAFLESLQAVDTRTIPRGGTDIAAAIREAQATFKTRTAAEKVLVLLTDGEDLEAEGIAAAKDAAKDGVKIYTVGVGTAAGEMVPTSEEESETSYVKDDKGETVRSRLDEHTLRDIAGATGGMYEALGARGEGLTTIYDKGLAHFARHDLSSRRAKVYLEQFHWALLAALACFISSMLIGTRRKVAAPRKTAQSPVKRRSRSALMAGMLTLLVALPLTGHSSTATAENAYRSGNFAKAEEDYSATAAKDPKRPELQFNAGSAAYKAGKYAEAAAAFQNTLKSADIPVQQGAYYDLGNSQYRLGEKTAQSNPQETIKTWQEAVKSYDAALQLRSDDADAKYNRELVQRKLEALKRQEEKKRQQQQQKQDQQQSNQEKNQDQNSQSQNQNSQDSKGDSQKNEKSQGGQGDSQNAQEQNDQGKSQDQSSQSQNQNSQDSKGNSQKDDKSQDNQGNSQDSQDQKGQERKQDKDAQGQSLDAKDSKDNAQKNDNKSGDSQAGEQPKDKASSSNPANANEGDPKQAQANAAQPTKPDANASSKVMKGKAEAAHGEQSGEPGAAAAAEERREPGQMTRREAKQLLDALKGDDQRAPAVTQSATGGQARNHQLLKDW
jgi:Ca-activated chloride channel family protein